MIHGWALAFVDDSSLIDVNLSENLKMREYQPLKIKEKAKKITVCMFADICMY